MHVASGVFKPRIRLFKNYKWFLCCSFMSYQHLRSWQGECQLVTWHTPGDLFSAAPLRDQVASTMTQHRTKSYYFDIVRTSPWPILLIPNIRLGSYKYEFDKSPFDSAIFIFNTFSLKYSKTSLNGPTVGPTLNDPL